MKRVVYIAVLLLAVAFSVGAAETRDVFYWPEIDTLDVKTQFRINRSQASDDAAVLKTVERVKALRESGAVIKKIKVDGRSSIDGPVDANLSLSRQRAQYTAGLLAKQSALVGVPVERYGSGEDWETFEKLVSESNLPAKREVLNVIRSSHSKNDKEYLLRTMRGKTVWPQLRKYILPALRTSVISIVWEGRSGVVVEEVVDPQPIIVPEPEPEPEPEPVAAPEPVPEPVPAATPVVVTEPEPAPVPAQVAEPVAVAEPETETPWNFFAIKNNLVLTGALVANLGAEVSFGKHFSLAVPVAWSPYTVGQNWRLRTFAVTPEFRWWIKEGWKGHFLGLQAHVAWFNVSTIFDRQNRYQDREGKHPLMGGGINYGYALPFGRNSHWGIEFTAGVGYAYLDYDVFYNIENGAQHSAGTKHYIGATNVGVNIYYRFCYDKKRRSGK